MTLKIAALALAACLFSTTAAFADDGESSGRVFGLGFEPHWLIVGGLGMRVDFKLSDSMSLVLGGLYVPPRSVNRTEDYDSLYVNYKVSMHEVYLGPTIFITGAYDHHGWYVTPALGHMGARISEYGTSKPSASLDVFELRAVGGYQWVVHGFRFITGGGFRLTTSNDIVIKDNQGNELLRRV